MRLLSLFVLFLVLSNGAEAKEGPSPDALNWAREVLRERLADAPEAEEFPDGAQWLNVSRPLTLSKELRGKVVILDFWCFCCINCLHVLPDLAFLEQKYEGKPVAVVGVHSAKFESEKDTDRIREAILRHEIRHPVVNDADFRIWRSYGVRSWPSFAILMPDGRFLARLSGEGQREDLDALIQVSLEHFEQQQPKLLNAEPLPMRLEREGRPTGALAYPGKLVVDGAGKRLFIADSGNNRIVEVGLDGRFLRAFGSGEAGLRDGSAQEARFKNPQGLALFDGALWVADTENHALRRIDLKEGRVKTVVGTGVQGNHWRQTKGGKQHGPWPGLSTALNSPWDLIFVKGRGYIAMAGSHSLWTLDPVTGQVSHFAGNLSERRLDAETPFDAAFAQPSGLAFDGTSLFVADSESSAVVKVSLEGQVQTVAGASTSPRDLFHFGDEDGVGHGRRFQHPLAVLFHEGLLYVADSYNDKIKTIEPKTRAVATFAAAGLREPGGLAALGSTLYVADTNNHTIRRVDLETKQVSELVLEGVPIPQIHARSGGIPKTWPKLPGTAFLAPVELKLKAAAPGRLLLKLKLPEGWKLTAGAPSALRLKVDGKTLDQAIGEVRTPIELPALEAGTHQATLRLLYYVCEDAGSCRMRSAELPLKLLVASEGETEAVVWDHFRP